MYFVWILTLAIISGQLIKIPIGTHGGATLLDVTVIALCLLGLWRLKFNLGKPPPVILGAIFFIAVATLSLILTPLTLDPIQTMTSFSYTIRFFVFVLLGWLIYLGSFPTLRKNIYRVLLISGLGLAILGLLQFIFIPDLRFLTNLGWDPHYFRTVSTFLDPNFAGAFFVLTIILWYQKFAIAKKWYLLLFLILYLALLTTFSRSSYLMFLVSGLTLSFLKKSGKIFISTAILFIILLIGFQTYSQFVAKSRGIDRGQSASFRVNTWEQGLNLFQKSPIFGIGFNAYRYAIKEYNLGDEQFIQSHGSSSNDSSLLFVAATTGVLGLIIYIYFIISLIKYSYPQNPVLISAMAGLLIHSFFSNSLFYPSILIWILLKASDIKD